MATALPDEAVEFAVQYRDGNNRLECRMLAISRLFRLIRGNNMSEDSNVPIEQVNEMKERINVTLKRLRDELATYWTSTGEVPSFIIGKPAPILPQDALNECLLYPHRDALLDTLPKSGIVAEVGTQYGHWAERILDVSSPKELHLFDLDFDNLKPKVNDSRNVRKHRGDSSKELSAVQDNMFDWIYIDGDHSYHGVKRDIQQAVRKIKTDGILVFNDYCIWSHLEATPYGVVAAVNELIQDGWRMSALALSPWGYWDVAVRRSRKAVR